MKKRRRVSRIRVSTASVSSYPPGMEWLRAFHVAGGFHLSNGSEMRIGTIRKSK
jgi:hypothetical protein